jgi:16S rRNA processing protein RimM
MDQDKVVLGFFHKAHGLKGEVKLILDDAIQDILQLDVLYTEEDGRPLPHFVESFRIQDGLKLLLKLEDFDSPEAVASLRKKEAWVQADHVVLFEESNSADLIGYEILDSSGEVLGKVEEVIEMPTQFLLAISYQDKEVLIPYSEELLINQDDDKKQIQIEITEGLLDL